MSIKETIDYEFRPITSISIYFILLYLAMVAAVICAFKNFDQIIKLPTELMNDVNTRDFFIKRIEFHMQFANTVTGYIIIITGGTLPRLVHQFNAVRMQTIYIAAQFGLAFGAIWSVFEWLTWYQLSGLMLKHREFSEAIISNSNKHLVAAALVSTLSALLLFTYKRHDQA